ncbi:RAB7A-interacting MON1-CCZ1 complex subunit 1 [Latimeria chalumnae]|uniref:RAB7A interacting MON1-CCZ1 complex subunit 1 n=1 Tax=Latimeria chalumnae TaxID=7897 RepID=H3A4T7_LATCH|nr:PREDICTED: UPF0600 protein C5orf51 homolog [Latimeria chalumnae]|eukprot:XP_006007173.1 PREDICTED: UPF0600 protein C5orf51 homolog [Latimeria chalumnae]
MAACIEQSADLSERIGNLERKCCRLRQNEENQDDIYLLRASVALEKLKSLSKNTRNENLSKLLQDYTQVVLDITFFEENRLVDNDFPEDISSERVCKVLHDLSEPEVLARDLIKDQDLCAVLGVEMVECLHWRRGAFLYMYCHTVREREKWLMGNQSHFKKCLEDGICHLVKMLHVRSPVDLNDKVLFRDISTARLLSEGVFSDTHLLAMMYTGEMCYWRLKNCAKEEDHDQISEVSSRSYAALDHDNVEFRRVGQLMLQKYISFCEGPLNGQGWSTESAKEILSFFKSA